MGRNNSECLQIKCRRAHGEERLYSIRSAKPGGIQLRKTQAVITVIYTDTNLYCIVTPDLLSPCCVSQPRRSLGYAIDLLPCRKTKSLAALDAIKLYISIRACSHY